MDKKYELTNETITVNDHTLHRIKALRDFGNVKKGDLGGFIEFEKNLSQYGWCWVFGEAKVYGDAEVYGDANVSGYAKVYGNAIVCGNAKVFDNADVFGNAEVYRSAIVFGYAEVYENAKVFGNVKVFGDAKVYDNAEVYDNAKVCGAAVVCGDAKVYDNAEVYGNAKVYRNARVHGYASIAMSGYIASIDDYIVIGPIGSRNGYTTVYRTLNTDNDSDSTNVRIQCGCFNGTPDEFFTKVDEGHKKGSIYHTQYTTIVKPMVDAMRQTSIENITDRG